MDFSANLVAIIGAVALVLLSNLWRRKRSQKLKGKLVPEAPGALPIIGHLHLLGGKKSLARSLGEMADKYGSIYALKLGVHPSVIITDHAAMKDCFSTNDKLFASRPHSSQATIIGYDYASFGFAPYGTYWRNIRKLATVELLSNHRAKLLNYVQISEVNQLVKDLYLHCKTHENDKLNMSERIDHLVMNMITRMVAGKRYFDGNKEERDEKGRPIGEIIREYMFVTGAVVPGDVIPFLGWFDINGTLKTMKRVSTEVDAIMQSWLEEHKMKKPDNEARKDFIDVMLSVVEDEPSLGFKRDTIIKATTTAMILAGSDTTSISTLWALSSLVNNRRVLELAQEEIDQKIGRDRCVEVADIEKLEYLNAIIKETLRLFPPGPLGVAREAAEDCFISGYFIQKGTRLFTHLWKLHRDPKVWSDPEEFIPERFLTTHAHLDVSGQYFEYLPFSAGRRSCPGMKLALQVLHLTLARLIQAFDLKTPNNEPVDMTEAPGIVMPRLNPLEVVLVPRLGSEFYERE